MELRKRMNPERVALNFSTIGDIIRAVLMWGMSQGAKLKSIENYASSLRIVLARAKGIDLLPRTATSDEREAWKRKVDALSSAELSRQTVRAFQAASLIAQGVELPEATIPDHHTERQMNVSINSTLTQARAVFSKEARELALEDLRLPDMSGFLGAQLLPTPKKRPTPLDPHAVKRMIDALLALKLADKEAWIYINLMGRMGLRNSEAQGARAAWLLRETSGQWRLDVRDRAAAEKEPEFLMKGALPRQIMVPDDLMDALADRKDWLIAPGQSVSAREDVLPRTVNRFMRQFFPQEHSKKAAYLLRGMAITAVRVLHGEAMSSKFAGHVPDHGSERGSRVTREHYDRAADRNPVPCVSWEDVLAGLGKDECPSVKPSEVAV